MNVALNAIVRGFTVFAATTVYTQVKAESAAAPVKVLYAKGDITAPEGVFKAGDGKSCTVSWDGKGRKSILALDFGEKSTGGYAAFVVTGFTGSPVPVLRLAYATHPVGLAETGCCARERRADYLGPDVDLPILPANLNRHEIYSIGRKGLFIAPLIQGQERYVRISLDTPGSVDIDSIEIVNAEVFSEEPVIGSFNCSDERLNDVWEASVWTCQIASFPNHNAWKSVKGRLLPRELAKAKSDGWCRTAAPCDGTLRVEYEFDANPHFPQGTLEILVGDRRVKVVQDSTNVLKSVEVPVKKGERFGFAAPKESWPIIHAASIGSEWKADFRDLSGWEFATTPPFIADGAKRDRLPWTGDLWWAGRNCFYGFGPKSPYIPSTLRIMAFNTTPEGYVHACPWPENKVRPKSGEHGPYPSDEFAMWLAPAAWDYYLYTADRKLLEDVWASISRLVGYIKSRTRADGIHEPRRETSIGCGGHAFGLRSMYHMAYVNVIQLMMYGDAAKIAAALGHEKEAHLWAADAERLAAAIRRVFWDEDKQCFIEAEERPYIGLSASMLALAAKLLTPEEAKIVMPQLFRNGYGKKQALIVRGKFEYGDTDGAFEALAAHSWYKEVSASWPGPKTFTECMDLIHDNYGDESHPDVCIAGIISANILGVAPVEPGFSRFSFRPHPGELKFAEGVIPTPHGVIRARWDRTATGLKAFVTVPEGTVCEFEYGSTRRTLGPGRGVIECR